MPEPNPMKDKKNLLASEKTISSVIVSYYLYFLNILKAHKGFASDAPRIFIPSLFIWGHISLANLLQRLKKAFDSVNFLSVIIDTHNLGNTDAEIYNYLSQELLTAAHKEQSLRPSVRKHRTRIFLAHNASRIIFFTVCLIIIIDFIHVDETNHRAMMSFLKRGSILIVLLGLVMRAFGPMFAAFIKRILKGSQHNDNIFASGLWQKMIRATSVNLRPFVIVFTQLNILSQDQTHIVFKAITALQRCGIICIGVGRKDYIMSILKSHEGAIHKDYYADVYPGLDYGLMQFETVFTLNMYLNKRSINHILGQIGSDTSGYTDPKLEYLTNKDIAPVLQATIDPYIALLHMNDANIIGITESLRLYSAILKITEPSKLATLIVFIVANRYDPHWLDMIATKLVIKDQPDEEEVKTNHLFSKHSKMQVVFIKALEKNKTMIPLLYETFGRVIPE
jgi:hypothetical protein